QTGAQPRLEPASSPRRRGRVRRAVGIAFVMLLLAAGGAAAVIATSEDGNAVQLRKDFSDTASSLIDELQQLVSDNTN
ncbi:MAG TPA: hypothetical protein VFZ89_17030, partial [Solirubrobacteraceae bacterium]